MLVVRAPITIVGPPDSRVCGLRRFGKQNDSVLAQAIRPEQVVERFDIRVVRRLAWS